MAPSQERDWMCPRWLPRPFLPAGELVREHRIDVRLHAACLATTGRVTAAVTTGSTRGRQFVPVAQMIPPEGPVITSNCLLLGQLGKSAD